MRTMTNRVATTLAVVALCSVMGPARADAQTDYTYTVIADVTNCFNIGSPALNNQGEVVFGANCGAPVGPPSGAIVIRRGDGGALTPIYTWDPSSGTQHVPQSDVISINDHGVVAFAVNGPCPNGGAAAIWTGDGASINTVHDICTNPGFTSVIRPSISNTGAVAFMAASGNSYDYVVRVANGTLVTIAGPGTSPTSVGTLVAALEPAINNHGVVTFMGQGVSAYGIFTSAGGAVTTISLDNPSTFNGINDDGRVAFVGANSSAIQTGDGGPLTTIATPSDTGFQNVYWGGGAAINGGGQVAFMAVTQSGAIGVFTGPDPDTDVVLKTGDVIPGFGTVTGLSILREAINDSTQVAMTVFFNDNDVRKVAIIRADPPNRAPVALNGAASVTAGESVSGTLGASDPDGDALTYAIVTNGNKGAAAVTDASAGAFTYTANSGAIGDDTFTFQVTDSRGLSSNIATVTVNIQPPACAANVTTSVSVSLSSLRLDRRTGRYSQRVTLRNTSGADIAGPVSFVLDSLTAGATLVNAAGSTSCASPSGSPYVNVNVGSDSIFSPRERANGTLEFTLEFVSPGAVSYTPRVLAGPGGR